ncbi:MAG: AAA family ATPase [Planctomycetota bacterium]
MAASATLARDLKPIALTGADRELIGRLREAHRQILAELRRKIVGQDEILEQLLICFFAGGHALLVGVPGLAKTLMVRSLAEVLSLGFNRIQFTPDLMPSDITGAEVIGEDADTKERGFRFLSGPIFNNMILADEINRTPPKTMAALLEAMEEYTVHVGGKKFEMPKPFFVLATQNPIEQEGTYTLPAAALDRFMMNIYVDYPPEQTEMSIVEMTTSRDEANLPVVLAKDDIDKVLQLARRMPASDEIVQYATALVRHTRTNESPLAAVREYVAWGASPRATQSLLLGAKVRALLYGREVVTPADVRAIALPVMRHRVMCNFHADSEGVTVDELIRHVVREAPRPGGDDAPGSADISYQPTAEHADVVRSLPVASRRTLGWVTIIAVVLALIGLVSHFAPAPAGASASGASAGTGVVRTISHFTSIFSGNRAAWYVSAAGTTGLVSLIGLILAGLLALLGQARGRYPGAGLLLCGVLVSVCAATAMMQPPPGPAPDQADAPDAPPVSLEAGGTILLSGALLAVLGLVSLAIRDWDRYAGLAAALPESARATLRPPTGLVAWLWGPETRRELELRARALKPKEEPRVERIMARRTTRKRMAPLDLTIALSLLAFAGYHLLNALWINLSTTDRIATIPTAARMLASSANVLFTGLLASSAIGMLLRKDFGKVLGAVSLGLLTLVSLMTFMFSEGMLHPSFSAMSLFRIDLFQNMEFGKVLDSGALFNIIAPIVLLVALFWRRDE